MIAPQVEYQKNLLEKDYAEEHNVHLKYTVNILDMKENCISHSLEIIVYLNYHFLVIVLQI